MKKGGVSAFFVSGLLVACLIGRAAVPEGFTYQGVARDPLNSLVTSKTITLRLSILKGSSLGDASYVETQSAATNQFGLFSVSVGAGTAVAGDFAAIDWAGDKYYLKVEADFAGGANYVAMGTSQLLSVPYALAAKTALSGAGVASVATSSPLTGGPITATGTVGIAKATAVSDGYLSKEDWSAFNAKGTSSLALGETNTTAYAGDKGTAAYAAAVTSATNGNTASTIVKRDGSGNFSAGTITANLTGNVTGSVTGNVVGTADTATNLTATLAVNKGGTGATDAAAARSNLGAAGSGVATASGLTVSATDKLLGRSTAGAGAVEEVVCSTAGRALIDDADAAAQRTTLGLGNVENTALSTWPGSANITTLGVITAGTISGDRVSGGTLSGCVVGTTTSPSQGMASTTVAVYENNGFMTYANGGVTKKILSRGSLFLTGNLFLGDGGDTVNSGTGNTFLGYSSGTLLNGGENNTTTGYQAMNSNVTGNNNTAIGKDALKTNTASDNTAVGYNAGNKNAAGAYNTAVGSEALYNNTGVGSCAFGYQSLNNNTANYSAAIGYKALYSNTTGTENTAVGAEALFSSVTTNQNVAVGYRALYYNVNADNVAVGHKALYGTSGQSNNSNVAIGSSALYATTTGSYNTAVGHQAMASNNSGPKNTALGYQAFKSNVLGNDNTAVGYQALTNSAPVGATGCNTAVGSNALLASTTGQYNTAFGYEAGNTIMTGTHNTCIGNGAKTSGAGAQFQTAIGDGAVCDADSHVRIGDTFVTQIGGQVAWSNLSDARDKENIADSDLGLDFILGLRPVKFNLKGMDETRDGFIAQEVERLCECQGVSFSAVRKPASPQARYALSYAEFVVPLVNAVKEQQGQIEALRGENTALKERLSALERKLGM